MFVLHFQLAHARYPPRRLMTKIPISVIDFEHYNGTVFISVNFKRIPSIFSQNTSDVTCVICKIKGTKCSDFLIANRLWAERYAYLPTIKTYQNISKFKLSSQKLRTYHYTIARHAVLMIYQTKWFQIRFAACFFCSLCSLVLFCLTRHMAVLMIVKNFMFSQTERTVWQYKVNQFVQRVN